MDQASKKPWQSRTILVNALVGVAAALLPFFPGLASVGSFFSAHSSEVVVVWSILNIVLRAITKDKISLVD